MLRAIDNRSVFDLSGMDLIRDAIDVRISMLVAAVDVWNCILALVAVETFLMVAFHFR